MLWDFDVTGIWDLGLTEADLAAQLPAIQRCQTDLPLGEWDEAWQAFVKRSQEEGTRR